jgi:hypothetical protein
MTAASRRRVSGDGDAVQRGYQNVALASVPGRLSLTDSGTHKMSGTEQPSRGGQGCAEGEVDGLVEAERHTASVGLLGLLVA